MRKRFNLFLRLISLALSISYITCVFPSSFSAIPLSDTTLLLVFGPPLSDGTLFYQLRQSSPESQTFQSIGSSTTTMQLTGLTGCTAYTYEMRACFNNNDCSTVQTATANTRASPGQNCLTSKGFPDIFTASPAGTQSVLLFMLPVVSGSAGYFQYRTVTPTESDYVRITTASPVYIVQNLQSATRYQFQLQFCNPNGTCFDPVNATARTSSASGEDTFLDKTLPSVSSVEVQNTTATSITITWSEGETTTAQSTQTATTQAGTTQAGTTQAATTPAPTTQAPGRRRRDIIYTQYEVLWCIPSIQCVSRSKAATTDLTYTITGLQEGTNYSVSVRYSQNVNGVSYYGTEQAVTGATIIGPLTNARGIPLSNTQILFVWTPKSINGVIYQLPLSTSNDVLMKNKNMRQTSPNQESDYRNITSGGSTIIDSLSPGTNYTFEMRACSTQTNECGSSISVSALTYGQGSPTSSTTTTTTANTTQTTQAVTTNPVTTQSPATTAAPAAG